MRVGQVKRFASMLTAAYALVGSLLGGGCDRCANPLDRILPAKPIETTCTVNEPDPVRAQNLAIWTALNDCYMYVAKREVSVYDFSGENFPRAFYDCIVGVRCHPGVTNGVSQVSVTIDARKIFRQIECPWVSVPVAKAERDSWHNKRRRLRKAVGETKALFADYPSRLYKATRIGMFEISKNDKTGSAETNVDTTYEISFDEGAFADLENRFRTIVKGAICKEKTVSLEKYNENRIREEYESFWNESGYDEQLGYRVISFLREFRDKTVRLRMLIVPAQIHAAVYQSISADSAVEFVFGRRGASAPIVRLVRAEISFWHKPYVDFASSEARPIEFRNWMCMENGNRDRSFTKREIRQGFKMPVDALKFLDRCDIRVYSGEKAEQILKAADR